MQNTAENIYNGLVHQHSKTTACHQILAQTQRFVSEKKHKYLHYFKITYNMVY